MSAETQVEGRPQKFGAFVGVFTPTLLTILGVIMYVRLGWVVGNAGLAGAWLILGLALTITICTGLSLSSIATNTEVGPGGPYAMITKSLGFEVGGGVGIPLYLTRPLGVAMYVFGFREGWQWIFPDHPAIIIDLVAFTAIFGLSYISANLAFRVQFLIMAVILVSLVSIAASPETLTPSAEITWWGDYRGFPERGFQGADFWIVFAVFFPATTGILAGANMSGDLKDPRRAIASGTMWAIIVSSLIYMALAWWVARAGTPDELCNNYTIVIDKAWYGPAVTAGLLGATFSSALAGAVGGPRILMAMGEHNLLPRSSWLSRTTSRGEPRNAIVLTALLTFVCLMMRDLNVIAPLVTMFFLITYCTINLVLLLESLLKLSSFRPTLRVPIIVPFFGTAGSILSMFVVSPIFGVIAVVCVIGIYWYIVRRGVQSHGEDVRSSMFATLAEWGATKASQLGPDNVRAWRPNLFVPVTEPARARGGFPFLVDISKPDGSVKLLGMTIRNEEKELEEPLRYLKRSFTRQNISASCAMFEIDSLEVGISHSLQVLKVAFGEPNTLFLSMPSAEREQEYARIMVSTHELGVGVLLFARHPQAGLGGRGSINVWVRPSKKGWDAHEAFDNTNLDLELLMAYRLMQTWHCQNRVRIITVVPTESELAVAEKFLADICELGRLPKAVKTTVMVGRFNECSASAPQCDLNIVGLQNEPDFHFMRGMMKTTRASCLFVKDSERASARA